MKNYAYNSTNFDPLSAECDKCDFELIGYECQKLEFALKARHECRVPASAKFQVPSKAINGHKQYQ